MSVDIISGASTDLLTVDATSKAARVTLYGPDGQALAYNSASDRGIVSIKVQQTATTGAGAAVWAVRNSSASVTLYISRIWFQLYQSGTGAATEMQYEFLKGTGCTAMSGGTALTPLKKRTAIANSDIDARVLDTGLTQTGITQGAVFYTAIWARLTHSATQAGSVSSPFVLDFTPFPIELVQNETLSIRNTVTAVVGDGIIGGCDVYGG